METCVSMMGPMGGMMDGMAGMMWLLMIGGAILTVAIIAAPVVILSRILRSGHASDRPDPAVTTLRDRYVCGEIDEDQYRQQRRTLDMTHSS